MMQQLSFSPVENILTVLFAAAILGYLLYLLVRSLRNRQRGYHTVNRAKVYSKAQATAVNQPVYLAGRRLWKSQLPGRKISELRGVTEQGRQRAELPRIGKQRT